MDSNSILETIATRKKQFEDFLEVATPPNKTEFLNLLKEKSEADFVIFFKLFVCGKDINEVVDVILEKTNIAKEEISEDYMKKISEWLTIFSDFIAQL